MTLHLTPESALALATALHDPAYALQAKRKAAADAIEDLINFLDETDGDSDFEHTGDELDASWPEDGREMRPQIEDEEDDGAAEPNLGSPEMAIGSPAFSFMRDYPRSETHRHPGGNQTHWAQGANALCRDDCEEVNEDGGDINDEPHDRADEGNEEHGLCYYFGKGGAFHEEDAPSGWSGSYEQTNAVKQEARRLLSRVPAIRRRDPDELAIIRPGVATVGSAA